MYQWRKKLIEWAKHLQSKVVPDSERAYYKALTEAYKSASTKLLSTNGVFTQARLKRVIKEITDDLYAINEKYKIALPKDIEKITIADNEYISQELQLTIKTDDTIYALPKSTIKELANISSMSFFRINADGVRIQTNTTATYMLNSIAKNNAEKVRGIIMAEYAQGTTVESIVRKIRPYMTTKAKANVRTVTRTLINEASTKAQQKFYSDNSEYIDGYIYVATLDSRTSRLCASLDGRRFKSRAAWYTPPLHFNCRSDLVSVPNGYEIGQRPIVLADGTIEVVNDKGFTYADALKRYPALSNNKLINTDTYIAGLGML